MTHSTPVPAVLCYTPARIELQVYPGVVGVGTGWAGGWVYMGVQWGGQDQYQYPVSTSLAQSGQYPGRTQPSPVRTVPRLGQYPG